MKDKNPFFLAIKLKEFDLKIAKTRLALYKSNKKSRPHGAALI